MAAGELKVTYQYKYIIVRTCNSSLGPRLSSLTLLEHRLSMPGGFERGGVAPKLRSGLCTVK